MNSSAIKLLLVVGARPNFMKMAPIIHEIHRRNAAGPSGCFDYQLLHTGQHYDQSMSSVFFDELGIPAPHFNLEVGSGSHAKLTARVMETFEPVCLRERPDWVIVVGDVNSTMACTLVCSKLGIKVAHVEAGLRSFDRTMPEEVNRIVTDALADLLLTPSEDGDANLLREGVASERIRCVGNVMIDALISNLPRSRSSEALQRLGLHPKEFAYVTLHRPSNVDHEATLRVLLDELSRVSEIVPVVFAMHPRTAKMCSQFELLTRCSASLRVIEPVGYHDSLWLTECAAVVLTDSGGLQEESTWFRTPCLTLRPNTERPVTVTLGSNRLTTVTRMRDDVSDALRDRNGRGRVPPLWDGFTSGRILDAIASAA